MEELIKWLEARAEEFEEDMEHAEADGNSDYAYAMGAKDAYEFVIKHLLKEN